MNTTIWRLKKDNIDCTSLPDADQQRIHEVGFDRWLDEAADRSKKPHPADAKDEKRPVEVKNLTRNHRTCTVCGVTFYSRRKDAVYCTERCKMRASRRAKTAA